VGASLFAPLGLGEAIARLGFVQADPIRAPARAQDLILRHRVQDYRAGQLEQEYARLGIEEDLLYAYGFVDRPVWRLLHPRRARKLSHFDRDVLARVREHGATHPRDLEDSHGGGRVVNAWGGTSKATTASLDRLHHAGLLRIARRERGQRVYEAVAIEGEAAADARLAELVLHVARLQAPMVQSTLATIAAYLARWLPGLKEPRRVVDRLVARGALERDVVDGVAYVWPAGPVAHEVEERVRLLAPFDPVVWDRRRFEQLWGWAYRFEAYTPVARRVRGYYALPMLWRDAVIGWANVSVTGAKLDVQTGFVGKRPGGGFRRELDAEVARVERFLGLC
jgi:uncharacterized protein YcaQ